LRRFDDEGDLVCLELAELPIRHGGALLHDAECLDYRTPSLKAPDPESEN